VYDYQCFYLATVKIILEEQEKTMLLMRKVQSNRRRNDMVRYMVRVNSSLFGNALKESNELSENIDTIIEGPAIH
jgi:hypothetical protein